MKVAVAGGGTAGHIEPALNTADALREAGIEVIALGTERGLETSLVPARGYELHLIPAIPLPRKVNADLFSLPVRAQRAVKAAERVLRDERVDVVVGFGGYVSLPAYLAAHNLDIPVIVHEANAKPGLANRIGHRYAAVTFDTVAGSMTGAETIGLPVRRAICDLDQAAHRAEALTFFGLAPERPTLLVFGGSQGARHLNDVIGEAAPLIIDEGWQVLHSVGPRNADHLVTDLPHYVCLPYIDRMDLAYAVADVAVTRAGAMTVAELSTVGVPSVYVPLPIGNGAQRRTARGVVDAGGGLLIADADFSVETLLAAVTPWLRDADARAVAAAAARRAGAAHAAGHIVDAVKRIGGHA